MTCPRGTHTWYLSANRELPHVRDTTSSPRPLRRAGSRHRLHRSPLRALRGHRRRPEAWGHARLRPAGPRPRRPARSAQGLPLPGPLPRGRPAALRRGPGAQQPRRHGRLRRPTRPCPPGSSATTRTVTDRQVSVPTVDGLTYDPDGQGRLYGPGARRHEQGPRRAGRASPAPPSTARAGPPLGAPG